MLRSMESWAGGRFLAGEMFPGVLAVQQSTLTAQELVLIDCATGAVLRRIRDMRSPLGYQSNTWRIEKPPPGSPAARLVESKDGKLYNLASLTAEPRLLLPPSPQ